MRRRFCRSLSHVGRLLVVVALFSPSAAHAQEPKPIEGRKIPAPRAWTDADYAGIRASSHPEVLTWERAYTLALIQYRMPNNERVLAETLDPKSIDEQAKGLGVADFERFRKDFLRVAHEAGEIGPYPFYSYHEPSSKLFGLLSKFARLERTHAAFKSLEQLHHVVQELLKGEASGLSAADLSNLNLHLEKARRRFLEELGGYRADLESVKVELGLSPHAPIVLDGTRLAGFGDVFDAIDRWQRDPGRKLNALPAIIAKLPALRVPEADQALRNALASDVETNPGNLEAVLRAAEEAATAPLRYGESKESRRSSVRNKVRSLIETYQAYEVEKRILLAAIRLKDNAFEQIVAPPAAAAQPGASSAPLAVMNLLPIQNDLLEHESQLIALWAKFHTERLALAHDRGMLPATDWKSFYDQIDGQPATRPVATPPPVSKSAPRSS